MTKENWNYELPAEEGVYKMKTPDGKVELVKIEDLAIDNNPNRPKNFHVIHINDEDPDNPEYYSLNSLENDYDYMWQRQPQ